MESIVKIKFRENILYLEYNKLKVILGFKIKDTYLETFKVENSKYIILKKY
jgi:hypothetical protein